jgi:peptidoglycan/LPS O-acetylase OafA/YrhL
MKGQAAMTSSSPRESKLRLELIDVLRFGAALAVVSFHWLHAGILNGEVTTVRWSAVEPVAAYGNFGVSLFFIISGFVIAQSASRGTAERFASSRAIRLLPAFWVAMTLTFLATLRRGGDSFRATAGQWLANLTMLPQFVGQPYVDGVYWTLTLEIAFYALVFSALFIGLGRWLPTFFPLWSIAMLVVAVFASRSSSLPYLGQYYAFFAGGAVLDTMRRQGFSTLRLLGLAAAVATAILFASGRVHPDEGGSIAGRPLVLAVGLTVLCFALVALTLVPGVASWRIPGSALAGSLTYPLYLLHAHLGYIVLNAYATEQNKWLVYGLMLVGFILTAWLMHYLIEIRMAAAWRTFFAYALRPVGAAERWLARVSVSFSRNRDGVR